MTKVSLEDMKCPLEKIKVFLTVKFLINETTGDANQDMFGR